MFQETILLSLLRHIRGNLPIPQVIPISVLPKSKYLGISNPTYITQKVSEQFRDSKKKLLDVI